MKWKPLVDEKDADIYRAKLSEISEVLIKNTEKLEGNIGLMGGKTGVAIFFFYYAQLTMEEKYVDFAHELINQIFDEINKEFSLHTFAGGVAGVGWMMEHLVQNDFVEADTDEILEVLDGFLHKAMMYDIEKGNYDFLHGAVGNGTYFLNRLPRPKAQEYLIELVDYMDKIGHRFEDKNNGIAWHSILDREKGTEGYNLSLSHGLASIIVFLGKLLEKDIHKDKASMLLEGAMNYMIANRLDMKEFKSFFPSWICEDQPPGVSRLAWCYGDLGVGAAILQAAKSAGNSEWEKLAMEVLQQTTTRRELLPNAVIDAGLCHGAAGIAHIYNRLYQETGKDFFKETAIYWLDQTMKMATYEDGYAGYKAWHTEKFGGWVAEAGLLEGVAGIGLMIINMISEVDGAWDRSLFLS